MVLLAGCKKDETVAVVNYVFITPRTMIMSSGRDTTASLSGGTPPYSIVGHAKFPTVKDSLSGSTLFIHAGSPGSTSIVVGDSAKPPQTAELQITVSANE